MRTWLARRVLCITARQKGSRHVSHHSSSDSPRPTPDPAQAGSLSPAPADSSLPVGDVLVRQDAAGYGIFNYRGEPVIEAPLRTLGEAARLAAEIVAPWHGRVRMAAPLLGH